MCTNGRYTERGVVGQNGYGAERYRLRPAYAMKIPGSVGDCGVLTEPASIVAKAFEQIGHIADQREIWQPRAALVLGAGSIGLLAALSCAQRGIELHVLDKVSSGPSRTWCGGSAGVTTPIPGAWPTATTSRWSAAARRR